MWNKLYKGTEPQVSGVNHQTSGEFLRVVSVNVLWVYLLLQYSFSSHAFFKLCQNSLHVLCLVDL